MDGWFRTGDKYHQDADGYFWYAGRADDTFKVNGRWLSPAEVESALIAHPAVLEAAVVAREDEGGLTKVAAFVVLKAGFSDGDGLVAELQEWVGRALADIRGLDGWNLFRSCRRLLLGNCSDLNCGSFENRREPRIADVLESRV